MQDISPPITDDNDPFHLRKAKLDALRNRKKTAYPNTFVPRHLAQALHGKFDSWDNSRFDECDKQEVSIAGRIMLRRVMGKASFMTLQDRSGRMQVYVRKDDIGELYADVKDWDIGDIAGVKGFLFKTQTGELTIHATYLELLTKALRPLPDKFHGISDVDMRYRKRYLDLMMNEDVRKVFMLRTRIIDFIRHFLKNHDYLEVETPMMQAIPGGAAARPFETFHNALGLPMYLRISPELYLKRLVVGGFERVFEINRNFRNEGPSTRHNPEFTMLEFYQAYATYQDLMQLTETMLCQLSEDIFGAHSITYQDAQIDFTPPFQRMTVLEAILFYNSTLTAEDLATRERAAEIAARLNIKVGPEMGLGKIQVEIFEKTAEQKLIQPTFITSYPAEVSPLARRNDQNPFVTDRFEFFVGGREIANGFSELNDPEDQAERFKAQMMAKHSGDEEAMFYDADYVEALEYGLAPTAGEGIGIDRLVMLFTNSPSIRDVILFPQMRPAGQ